MKTHRTGSMNATIGCVLAGLLMGRATIGLAGDVGITNERPKELPLLVRTQNPGMGDSDSQFGMRCELYRKRLVVRLITGPLRSSTVTALQLDPAVVPLIAEAEQGVITESAGPTDVPTVFWNAFRVDSSHRDDGRAVPVRLRARGSLTLDNDSRAAALLIRLIDAHCPPISAR